MKIWAYILNGIAAVGGLVLGGGLCIVSLVAFPDTHDEGSRQFLIMLAVCGVLHLLLPWLGIFFLRRQTTGVCWVSYGISILSILISGGLLVISSALLFGIANP